MYPLVTGTMYPLKKESMQTLSTHATGVYNTEQLAAINHPFGRNAIVRAAPGSGKTRVLVQRILHLLEQGVPASSICAITFTNKAAKEIKARLSVGLQDWEVTVATFHGLGYQLISEHHARLGFTQKPTVLGDDSKLLIKQALARIGIKPSKAENTLDYPKRLEAVIHQFKSDGMKPNEVSQLNLSYIQGLKIDLVIAAFESYQELLLKQNLLDFDDLILLSTQLLPEINFDQFDFVMVDEFQDTSHAQYQMLKRLGAKDIMVIGDPAQSIYSWRGANPEIFDAFEADYAPLTYLLTTNYRSTASVLETGNCLMRQHNATKMVSNRDQGSASRLFEAGDDIEEAAFIASELQFFGLTSSYSDAAVLVRMSSQIRVLERALASAGVPYRLVGSHSFWERIEIKLAVTVLRLSLNPLFEPGLVSLIEHAKFTHVEDGQKLALGDGSLEKIQVIATANQMPLLNALSEDLKSAGLTSRAAAAAAWVYHVGMPALLVHNDPRAMLEYVLRVWGYLPWLGSQTDDPEAIGRLQSLAELFNLADLHVASGGDLESFLEVITLERSQQSLVQGSTGEHVTVSTIHAAKGLEWNFVIVPGFDQGILPSGGALRDNSTDSEELRVAFVALTRAKDQLLLTRAAKRRINGEQIITTPSQYLRLVADTVSKTQITSLAVFG
jgi:DNA helicase II / ATP-dependent DNA helicase PcrA